MDERAGGDARGAIAAEPKGWVGDLGDGAGAGVAAALAVPKIIVLWDSALGDGV